MSDNSQFSLDRHHPFQHQNLTFVLGFMIDEVVKYPAQTVVAHFPVTLESHNALKIFLSKPKKHIASLISNIVHLL